MHDPDDFHPPKMLMGPIIDRDRAMYWEATQLFYHWCNTAEIETNWAYKIGKTFLLDFARVLVSPLFFAAITWSLS
jgi:hypothetical protein